MPNPLDYGAGIKVAGAFNVTVPFDAEGKAKLPGSRFKDYIPKEISQPTKASEHVAKKTFMRAPVARFEKDYIGPEESAIRRQSEQERITQMAKELWESEKDKRIAWKAAEDLVAKNPDSESAEVVRARKILERTSKPLTKEEIKIKAFKQYYGMKSS